MYNIKAGSFTKRSGMGFFPTNDISSSIRVLYTEAMKSLIELKSTTTFLGQIEPVIEKWSIDADMERELLIWVEGMMPTYKKDLEAKREEFMNNLAEEDDSLLDIL